MRQPTPAFNNGTYEGEPDMRIPRVRRLIPAAAALCILGSPFVFLGVTDSCADPGTIVIQNVRIFDGDRIIPSGTVVIEGGKIAAAGAQTAIPAGAEIIDGAGLTLMPGLIDAHVHVLSEDNLKQALVFGVTSVVDMFSDVKAMQGIKERQAEGKAPDMAFLVSAGTLATVPGGHGTEYGVSIPTITSPDQAQAFVDERIAEGSDFIKIIQDDGSAYNYPWKTLTNNEVAALIQAAHKRGKLAVIHAATLKNCEDALNAGVDGLVHLYFDDVYDPDFGRLAAKKKAFVIPTLSALKVIAGLPDPEGLINDADLSPYLKPSDVVNLKKAFPFATGAASYKTEEKALRQLKDAKVPILAGTDAPNPGTAFGASLHGELALLVSAGLAPLEALKAATSVSAAHFHITDRGRIRPGFAADLVLVEGDPSVDITTTRRIVGVWRDGVRVNREAYAAVAAAEKEKAAQAKNAAAPDNSESGWISDFEGDSIAANFGAGWMKSTDAMMGGKSKVEYKLTPGGAEGSRGALQIKGEIIEGSQFRWAGAFFCPGKPPMTPVNLSSKKAISFWAKGDVRTYAVEIFAQSLGYIPAIKTFSVGAEWKEFKFPFTDFNLDGSDIMGIFIGASGEPGAFTMTIDNVRLE
jgi:imidazolonepropionase-like amidohydrolase